MVFSSSSNCILFSLQERTKSTRDKSLEWERHGYFLMSLFPSVSI
jgi:hypothetical protein